LDARGIREVGGALADLGVSSMQFDAPGRGFSFQRDEPLDMRMDQTSVRTAADLVRDASEQELADAIHEYGEERFARRIARAIVHMRSAAPIESTGQLAEIVRRAIPRRGWSRIDPATRTFQALRIWVNQELDGLEDFLVRLLGRLAAGARAVVIAFHSLEDRIVKHTFRSLAHPAAVGDAAVDAAGRSGVDVTARVLTKKPIVPSDEEIARNPRARSAKLRAIERVA
jgi:16S rRNA (cytosine1402-N4)-methyltransferase